MTDYLYTEGNYGFNSYVGKAYSLENEVIDRSERINQKLYTITDIKAFFNLKDPEIKKHSIKSPDFRITANINNKYKVLYTRKFIDYLLSFKRVTTIYEGRNI